MVNKRLINTGVEAAAFDPLQNFETVTYTGNGSTQKITGYIRKGAAFDGSSSYITTPVACGDIDSFSAWFYWISGTTQGKILGSTVSTGEIACEVSTAGKVNFILQNKKYVTNDGELSSTGWYHVYYDIGQNLYINGTQVTTGTASTTTRATGGTAIIGAVRPTSGHFNSVIDQVRFFNTSLNSTQISQLAAEDYSKATKSTTDIFGDGSGVALYELDENANDTGGIAIDSGQSGDFDGSSNIGLGSAFTGGTITFSVWFKTTNTGTNNTFFANGGGQTATGRGIFFHLNSSGYLRIVTSQGGASQNAVGSTNVADGNWHNAVMSYNSGTVNIYLDGNTTPEVTSTSLNYTGSANCDFTIGSFISTSSTYGDYFNGQMDDIRIYNTALTSTQAGYIANNDTSNIPTSQGYYKLDGNANDSAGSTNGAWSGTEAYSNPAELLAYNGTATNVNFLGMAFQPDLVWIKDRDTAYGTQSYDSVRGVGEKIILSSTQLESFETNGLTSFDSNGFTISSLAGINANTDRFVAWCWKAGGVPTPNNNTEGTITSTVSANQDAGFSIVKWTSNGSSLQQTKGHGLSQAPELIIIKNTDLSDNWFVYSSTTGNSGYLRLNTTDAAITGTNIDWLSNSTTFGHKENSIALVNNVCIAYCFHSVDSYQRIGSYTGNDSSKRIYTDSNGDGTGTGAFAPRFLLIKCSSNGGTNKEWNIFDTTRDPSPINNRIEANTSDTEFTDTSNITINSDGFTLGDNGTATGSINQIDFDYVYLAIA